MMTQPTIAKDKNIKIGMNPGPSVQIFEVVKKEAAKQGVNIQIVEFADLIAPNVALAAGDIDGNCYTYESRIDQFNAEGGYKQKLASIGRTNICPLSIYSKKKIRHLDELPLGAKFAIPNDPINTGRVLLLLQEKGLVKLNPAAGMQASTFDIIDNPKQIQFIAVDSAQTPRALDDTHVAAITINFALAAGLNPSEAITHTYESPTSPYSLVFAVREGDEGRPEWKLLLDIYRGQVVQDFISKTFKVCIKAW